MNILESIAKSEKRKGVKIAKRQNPDWPENYINAVIREHEAGKIVLAGVFFRINSSKID